MNAMYDRIMRLFLHAVQPYDLSDTTPRKQLLPYLRSFMWPMRWVFVASVIVTVVAAGVEVWLIQFAGQIVDLLATTSPGQLWADHGFKFIVAAAIIALVRPVAHFLRTAVNDVAMDCNIATIVRWRAYDHLIRQSVGWFQEDLTGRTSGRLVDIGNHVADSFYTALNTVGFGLVYMIGVVILMAGTEIWLAAPLLVWMAMYIGVLAWVIPKMVGAQFEFQKAKSGLVGSVVDNFGNFDTLKLFAPRDQIAREQRGALEHTRQTLFTTRKISIALWTSLVALEAVILVGFVGYGIWLWNAGLASVGLVAAAIALSLRIATMAQWILDSMRYLFLRIGSLKEALLTIGQPITIPNDPDSPKFEFKGGAIQIQDLHHHYGLGKGGLDGISLNIKPGEKVGLVGRSGSGKSTLVNLILRFFEAERGNIVIDGQNIRDVEQDSLRGSIGMVAQQASLLNKSVRDNILLGREDVSEAELVQAAIAAHAHEFILQLKDNKGREQYEAHVGERGVKLSGGQRQRVAIARVILKDAPILILDEATSALDSEVEAEIQQALDDVMENKTVIAIAHRLSTIAKMDRIIVMDGGRIVEQGTHDQLKAGGGLYADFWNRQSDGFIDTREVEEDAGG